MRIKIGDRVIARDVFTHRDEQGRCHYGNVECVVTDFARKHGQTTVGLDIGEWRYLNEVTKVRVPMQRCDRCSKMIPVESNCPCSITLDV